MTSKTGQKAKTLKKLNPSVDENIESLVTTILEDNSSISISIFNAHAL